MTSGDYEYVAGLIRETKRLETEVRIAEAIIRKQRKAALHARLVTIAAVTLACGMFVLVMLSIM